MGKLIIENRSSKNDLIAIKAVQYVMESGRVSNNGRQYCYCTTFNNGIAVSTDLNKKSDRFVVVDYPSSEIR